MFDMPFKFSIVPGEGLAPGIGMFIPGMFICSGEAPGDAEGMGMFIPGMFIC